MDARSIIRRFSYEIEDSYNTIKNEDSKIEVLNPWEAIDVVDNQITGHIYCFRFWSKTDIDTDCLLECVANALARRGVAVYKRKYREDREDFLVLDTQGFIHELYREMGTIYCPSNPKLAALFADGLVHFPYHFDKWHQDLNQLRCVYQREGKRKSMWFSRVLP